MKVAISSDFFTALAKLPKTQMNKTVKLVEKFKNDPTSSGINYEKLHFSSDSRMYSIRVDNSYRCIVLKPEKGDVYILLWVDHHDEAYDWAKRHRCSIHPETGSLQILETEHTIQDNEEINESTSKQTVFSHFRDKELLRLGVPKELLSQVKMINSEDDLDALQTKLPEEAYEALFYLLAGDSYEEVIRYLEIENTEKQIDTQDFAKALEHANSKRRFYVVDETDIDLISMLNAPLEKWRVFLHPSQRTLVYRDWNGPVRVLGGAGTGKTVVAMHRAKWLAQKVLEIGEGKILFTTFTKNLAHDIYDNLKKICTEDQLRHIEVKNFDQWVYEFLYKNGYQDRIVYADETKELWEEALSVKPADLELPDSFFKEEWERVVQPQSIANVNEYIKASRVGRGTRLNRSQRKAVWEVFEEYRLLLSKHRLKEPSDAMRDAKVLVEAGKLDEFYKSIIVDEAQDFSTQAFKLLRALVPEGKNDLFIVGDAHQRIYGHKVVLGQCGIKVVGRSRKLKLNYRTTDEIRKWAVKIFENRDIDDLDDGIDRQNDYKSLYHGPSPVIKCLNSFDEEIKEIKSHVESLFQENNMAKICLVLRTKKLRDTYAKELEKMGIPIFVLDKESRDDLTQKALRVATMHRVKGLDFDHIIISCVNDGVVPYNFHIKSYEEKIQQENLLKERALLYVSATRAKKTLLITGYGSLSEFIRE
jgi:superfamily I DNA/RNA helicase/mRNA-degrading endonuclease RelE of RelBE toxin-antitoxin system